jgi:hypothetical protein
MQEDIRALSVSWTVRESQLQSYNFKKEVLEYE